MPDMEAGGMLGTGTSGSEYLIQEQVGVPHTVTGGSACCKKRSRECFREKREQEPLF